MRYRAFGDETVQVSEVAFGTGDNAGALIHGSSREQLEIIESALLSGINLFDTSSVYGRQTAETNLGRVLSDLSARDAFIMTKAFVYRHDLTRIRDRIRDCVDDSLLRLRRAQIDFLLLHNPLRMGRHPVIGGVVEMTATQALEQAVPVLLDCQRQGKIRFIGLACDDAEPHQVQQAMGSGVFSVMNLAYNLVNPSAARSIRGIPSFERYDGLFALAEHHRLNVAVVRPLAGGALASTVLNHGLGAMHPHSKGYFRTLAGINEHTLSAAHRFAFLERPGEQTLAQAAYRYILSHPQVSTAIGGFSSPEQLTDAITAVGTPLTPNDLNAIERIHQSGYV